MIPALSIVARSGMGKTTFLERLIPLLIDRGYRVGVVKHAHHTIELDTPGKDSYRLREAGAAEMVVNAPNQMALIRKQEKEIPLHDLLTYFRNVDLILIEGYKGEDLPRIEIFRSGAGYPEPLFLQGKSPIALVTDESFPGQSFSIFPMENIKGVADLIEKEILNK
jgi:molybdopterin-guanine dinucleotide biosynthesis protein MobB